LCLKDPYNKLLDNKALKDDWDKYIKVVQVKISIIAKIEEYMTKVGTKCIPPYYSTEKFSDGTKIGPFWNKCKRDKLCLKEPYRKLLENDLLKYDWDMCILSNVNNNILSITI
jgi:hypothetical protein